MLAAAAYFLNLINIRNLGFAYFLLAPAFLHQADRVPVLLVFGLGHLFTLAILLLFLGQRLATFNHWVKLDRLALLILALIAVFAVSVLVNTPANLLRPDKVVFWYLKFVLPACAFLVMLSIWGPRDIPRLYSLLAALGFFSALLVISQLTTGFPGLFEPGRYSSFYRDPNGYVLLLNVLLAFTLPVSLRRFLQRRPVFPYLAANALLLAGVGLTGSRGGILTTVAIVAVSFLATRNRRLILGLALLSIPFLAASAMLVLGRYENTAAMSDFGRIWSYLVAVDMIRENPFFGVGFGNVLDRFVDFGALYYRLMRRSLEIHNAFLEVFAEGGVLAFLLFCVLILVPTGLLFRRVAGPRAQGYPYLPLIGLNIMVAFLIYSMFYPECLGHDDFWAYYAVVILILRVKPEESESILDPGPEPVSSPSARPGTSG